VEKGFFKSLSILAEAHHFSLLDVSDRPYPYNILLAHWDASQQLKGIKADIELSLVNDENNGYELVATETVSTGSNLYYIPVLPLYQLLGDRRHRKCGELLLSVFAYLYRVAAVPYFRNDESYLSYHYEMLSEWVEDSITEMDECDYLTNLSALREAAYYGDIMQRKMNNPCHLAHFNERVKRFHPLSIFEHKCLGVAKDALDIWQKYPDSTIYSHIEEPLYSDDDDYDNREELILINEYISFIAGTEGSIYQSLSEMINSEFNEKMNIQEPTVTVHYNDNYKHENNTIEFERNLLLLIDDLCFLLNNLP